MKFVPLKLVSAMFEYVLLPIEVGPIEVCPTEVGKCHVQICAAPLSIFAPLVLLYLLMWCVPIVCVAVIRHVAANTLAEIAD